ncbi:MAG: UDP-N-acetylenolpyruvoylglucosamine reductase [Pseudonocardiales bacterium]|nr:UDP-N-acetylenolpyruvoylglucosamine reductase [Pseudonocardiales bacterium]
MLLVGGGSNLAVSDAGWPGDVVQIASRGLRVAADGDDVLLDIEAGEPWDDVVALAVEQGWSGIETLSGIPGCTGATPVQNVGAYGSDMSRVLESVDVWDRVSAQRSTWPADAVRLGYRDSAFKHSDRFVVLGVRLRLQVSAVSIPLEYAQVTAAVGAATGGRAPLADVRAAVLALRASKGMVLDAGDPDTWSVGSFFTNPVVAALPPGLAAVPDTAHWPAVLPGGGLGIKLSAAWLIQSAGFGPGFSIVGSAAAVSGKHALALTNRGGATAAQIIDLARVIRDGVLTRYGVALLAEPRLVGLEL